MFDYVTICAKSDPTMIQPAGKFTKNLWLEIASIYENILRTPFVLGLQKGNLPKEHFINYLTQDVLYLKDDEKVMKMVATIAPTKEEKEFFTKMHSDVIALEKELNTTLSKNFVLNKKAKKSKTTQKYSDFLFLTCQKDSYASILSALLPCFWLYGEVGMHIYKTAKKNNIYKDWIDFYNNETFLKEVCYFINLVENIAQISTSKERSKMKKQFIKASEMELEFFLLNK